MDWGPTYKHCKFLLGQNLKRSVDAAILHRCDGPGENVWRSGKDGKVGDNMDGVREAVDYRDSAQLKISTLKNISAFSFVYM